MNQSNTYGLTEKQFSELRNIFKDHNRISQVILFGSRALGSNHKASDIDLCLKGENLSISDLSILGIKIDELFLPYKYDLVIYDRINNQDLKDHIDRIGVALL